MTKPRVFADTNVIVEAFRTGCWAAICEHFAVETVEKCVEEALTGDPLEPGRIDVPSAQLLGGLAARHAVTKKQLAQKSGATRGQMTDLKEHYRASWLDEIKTKVRFGIIP